jgi:KDO2-lipid IV(A) lauroyltransferase
MNMVEFCLFPRIVNLQNFDRFVRFRNEQMVKDWLAQGHSAILVSAHLGNWELGACAVSMKAVPCYSIARPLKNPILDRWLNEMRQRTGARVFPKTGALRSMVRYLHEGKLLVFLLDQHAGDKGIPVEFFGRKAYTFDSVATISKRFHVPVFLAFDRRIDDRFFHEMRCVARVDPDAGSVEELTAQYTRLIEQAVRETPDQWLWMHRRWKESKPRASADKVPPADPVHGLASESQASGAPPMAT